MREREREREREGEREGEREREREREKERERERAMQRAPALSCPTLLTNTQGSCAELERDSGQWSGL